MYIVLLGPPGAGKGTQGEKLEDELGLAHIVMGDILRQAVKEKTFLGRQVQSFMQKGRLVPDFLIFSLLEEKVKEENRGFILDGFPRNLEQAKKLDEILRKKGKKLDLVINIEVGKKEIIKRLTGRLICPRCGKVYHKDDLAPAKICENCQVKLQQRKDDDLNTVKNRIGVYLRHTSPLIDYYKERGILRHIQGEGSPEEVFQNLKAQILTSRERKVA